MQRYYGLDLYRCDLLLAANCAANLPLGSATLARIEPVLAYSFTDLRLHQILNALCNEPVPFPWDTAKNGLPELGSMDEDELDRWYSQEFKEVDSGREYR